jgi:hypothetical protein
MNFKFLIDEYQKNLPKPDNVTLKELKELADANRNTKQTP